MLALLMGFLCAFGQDFEFFGGDDWLPVAPDGLGRDAYFGADDPTGIEPVVKMFGQRVDGCSRCPLRKARFSILLLLIISFLERVYSFHERVYSFQQY